MSENKVIDKQFKLDAVQYRKDHPELTFQQVADNLGVSNSSIHRWCKQFDEAKNENEDSNLFRGSGNFSSDEAKELARLKKDNKGAEQCKADNKLDIQILSNKLQTDVTTNVVTGKADVFYADSPVAGYAISQTDGQLEALGEDVGVTKEAVAIKKGDSDTAKAVQAAMQKLMDDGTYMKILKHWGVESGAVDKAEINPTDLG
jgi:amino acid ABC transporter substrate-binding protein, PAAT family (TC 3.A.1.3.-)